MKLFPLALVLFCAFFSIAAMPAHAEVTLFNQNEWKIGLYGFLEFDSFYDTTRGFTEFQGNAAVPRKGTYNGDNGRTQFSMRNTRFAFNVVAPEADGWKTHGILEMDFLGYDPAPNGTSSTAPTNSESGFIANPTLRIRHAYFTAEKNDLQILVGQTWSLFGWQPAYTLASVSVNPDAGTAYQRLVRLGAIQSVGLGENTLQAGLSIERPTERDGKVPNVVAGARYAVNSRKSGFNGPNSDVKTVPMSVALTGTYRDFTTPANAGVSTAGTQSYSAYAVAVDALLPVLASSDGKDVSNTFTVAGEFTIGKGYGDEYPNWTGGLGQTFTNAGNASATATANNTNLDPGLGGYNSAGNFQLLDLRTWNAQGQYHFNPTCWMTFGYGQIWSSNMGNFLGGTNGYSATNLVDRVEAKFVGFGHDITPQIRIALEFDQFTAHYVADGATNFDNRYMLASYFRF